MPQSAWFRFFFRFLTLVIAVLGIMGLWTLLRPASFGAKISAHLPEDVTPARPAPRSANPPASVPLDAEARVEGDVGQPRVVVLRVLDKVTLRVREYTLDMGQSIRFGTLDILVRTCQANPPNLPPENGAFLQIDERHPGRQPQRIFSGWMFSSSPALNALENSIYDVWVVACKMDFSDVGPDTIVLQASDKKNPSTKAQTPAPKLPVVLPNSTRAEQADGVEPVKKIEQ